MTIKKFYIYKLINAVNGKIYVGKTDDIKTRWRNHCRDAAAGKTRPICRAIKKYGPNNFTIEIIECLIVEEKVILEREEFWIKELRSQDRNVGYNLTSGGEGLSGYNHTPESKLKMTEKANEFWSMDTEARKRISEANSGENNGMAGRTHTNEARQKMSEFQSVRPRRPLTEEEKENMSLKFKGKPKPPPILQETKDLIVNDYLGGQSTKKQISAKYGVKYNTVVKIIKTYNKKVKLENK